MNKRGKNGLISLAVILISTSLLLQNAGGIGSGNEIAQNGSSRMLDIPFFEQRHPLFYGQASAQMILAKFQDRRISQFRLDDEMGFIPGRGTKAKNMKNPFDNRGIGPIKERRFLSLRDMRNSVEAGQFVILLIQFDEASSSGHFVVLSGYNTSGFFVHDPFPEEFGEPEGREAGENAFLSNALFRELHFFSRNFALIIGAEPLIAESRMEEMI